MIIFPAIDLKDGSCVRLVKGDMEQATVFNTNPVAQATSFQEQGFEWLHVVDLNGAFKGTPVNLEMILAIKESVGLKIQVGGGIRSMETIDNLFAKGVDRLVLGTAALKDPELVFKAAKKYPNRIVVGVDARDGKVAVSGWAETSEILVVDLAKKFEEAGVAAILYTNIDRDGVLVGVDAEGTKQLAEATTIPVIASGGVGSIDDIIKLRKISDVGIEGVIVGRALYEGAVDTADLLREAS